MSDVMQLVGAVGTFIAAVAAFVGWLGQALLPWLPGGLWCAWWLWCVNWKHAWPVLARGGWIVVVLLTFVSALAWSGIFPSVRRCLASPLRTSGGSSGPARRSPSSPCSAAGCRAGWGWRPPT